MNYCPRCGAPLIIGQNFCRNCGSDVRTRSPDEQALVGPAYPVVKGLGRNTLVYLTQQGLAGTKIRSDFTLFLAFTLPIPFLLGFYLSTQVGALAVYATVWLATSTFLYDELRGRGLKRLQSFDPEGPDSTRTTWLIPWRLIRMADWNGKTLWFSSSSPPRKASVTFDNADGPIVESTLASWRVGYSWRPPRLPGSISNFWTLSILFFAISQVILILAATLPFFPGEQQMYSSILNNTRSQVVGSSFLGEFREIYVNNIQVALGGALPFLGTLTFGVASYNTGRVIQVIALGDHVPSAAVLLALYVLPHTWVEEFSYPMATVAGLLAVTRWDSVSPGEFVKRKNRASGKYLLALGGVAMTLLLAGLLETTTTYLGYAAVALWMPLVVLYYGFRKERKRRQRDTSAQTGHATPPEAAAST